MCSCVSRCPSDAKPVCRHRIANDRPPVRSATLGGHSCVPTARTMMPTEGNLAKNVQTGCSVETMVCSLQAAVKFCALNAEHYHFTTQQLIPIDLRVRRIRPTPYGRTMEMTSRNIQSQHRGRPCRNQRIFSTSTVCWPLMIMHRLHPDL
jgi:hypothetical protein